MSGVGEVRSSPFAAVFAIIALTAMLALARAHDRRAAAALQTGAPTIAARPRPEDLLPVEVLLQPIDVNHASETELERLPRIGPAMAARIVAHRPYRRVEDLERVPGIGPRTLEALRAHVIVTPD